MAAVEDVRAAAKAPPPLPPPPPKIEGVLAAFADAVDLKALSAECCPMTNLDASAFAAVAAEASASVRPVSSVDDDED